MTDTNKNCTNCRFHATSKRKKIIDATGFDDQLMFDDEDETVYTCLNVGSLFFKKELLQAVSGDECGGWSGAPVSDEKAEALRRLDEMIAKAEERRAKRPDKE